MSPKATSGAALAIDAACASDRKKVRKDSSHEKSLPMLVSKAIRDNLKGWTPVEIDGTRDSQGLTCRDRITARKRLNLGDKRSYPLGKTFYAELRSIYRAADSPQKLLKPTGDEEIHPELLKAMIAYKKSGARASMTSYLETCDTINATELCGVLQYALELRASTSYEQLRCAKAVLNFLAEKRVKALHPALFQHIRRWADETLTFIYTKAKQTKIRPSDFISCNRDVVLLLLPEKELDTMLTHVGEWLCWEGGSMYGSLLGAEGVGAVAGPHMALDDV